MRRGTRLDYVRDFADLCENMAAVEIEDVVPRIIDVLPHILQYEFGIAWESRRNRALQLLKDRAYESAVLALVPQGTRISMDLSNPMRFTFTDEKRRLALRTYESAAPSVALGLIGAWLRFLADEGEFSTDCGTRETAPRLNLVVS